MELAQEFRDFREQRLWAWSSAPKISGVGPMHQINEFK
jgi:hypothetical protein